MIWGFRILILMQQHRIAELPRDPRALCVPRSLSVNSLPRFVFGATPATG